MQTFNVIASRAPAALEKLKKLAKKARRYGNDDITFTASEPFTVEETVVDWSGKKRTIQVERVAITVEGGAPRVGDHEFIATLEAGEDGEGNLIRAVPGMDDIEHRFRDSGNHCEHCQTHRQRKEMYVLRDRATGEQKQVGKSCLRDYLGIDDPAAILAKLTFSSTVRDEMDEYCGLGGGAAYPAIALISLLSLTVTCIRLFGWTSRAKAEMDERLTSTSWYVQFILFPPLAMNDGERELRRKILDEHNESDEASAHEALTWLREEMTPNSDYLHNLKVVSARDIITNARRIGIACSAVPAFYKAREMELRRATRHEQDLQSTFQGSPKQRLRNVPVTLEQSRVVGSGDWGDRVLNSFRDEAGNIYNWFSNRGAGLEIGEKALITGTVKEHTVYNGVQQTILSRVAISN